MKHSFWILLSLLFLALSFFISSKAIYGHWHVRVCGVEHQYIWDPGSLYIGSGLSYFQHLGTKRVGHPGVNLTALINGLALGMCALSGLSLDSSSYFSYLAGNLPQFILMLKMLITGLHLCSFFVIYLTARTILDKEIQAKLAVMAYATSYPLLFYLNNISVEPLMVIFTFLALLTAYQCASNGQSFRKKNVGAALCGMCTSLAIASKGIIVAPLLLLIPLFFIFSWLKTHHFVLHDSNPDQGLSGRQMLLTLAVYFLSCALLTVIWGSTVNWDEFFRFWFRFAPGQPAYDHNIHWLTNFITQAGQLVRAFFLQYWNFIVELKWVPGISFYGIFYSAEIIFLPLSILGLFFLIKDTKKNRGFLILMLIFCLLISPMVVYRATFHYFFFYLVLACIGLSSLVYRSMKALNFVQEKNQLVIGMLLILFIHSPAMYFAGNAKYNDILEYRQSYKAYYDGLQKASPGEKIAIMDDQFESLKNILGRIPSYTINDKLYKEVQKYFSVTAHFDQKNDHFNYVILRKNGQAILQKVNK